MFHVKHFFITLFSYVSRETFSIFFKKKIPKIDKNQQSAVKKIG